MRYIHDTGQGFGILAGRKKMSISVWTIINCLI